MPTAPLRPCTGSPSCPHMQGQCPTHIRTTWRGGPPQVRIRGRKLQKLRQELFTAQPLCVLCLQSGRTTIATIRDHIVNLKEGGIDTLANTQGLCTVCHEAKRVEESNRGRVRHTATTQRIMVVCGPPGSGKTTYVENRRRPGDLVWDMDAMAQALAMCPRYPRPPHVTSALYAMRSALIQYLNATPVTAYLIVTDTEEAQTLAKNCHATVVHLEKRDVLRSR